VLLIIPGILWTLSYSLIVPAILVEGQKAGPSLRRSSDLVKGQRGKVFLVLLAVNLLQVILAGGIAMISGLFFTTETGGSGILKFSTNQLRAICLKRCGIL